MKNNKSKTELKNPLFEEDNEEENNNLQVEIIEPKRNYFILKDSVYRNNNLDANELAILIKLLTASPTFKINANGLMWSLKIAEKKYKKAINGLKHKGYLKIEQNGKHEYKYIVSQEPQIKAENLTFDYLSRTEPFNIDLWNTLLKTHLIDYETYNNLWENLTKIAKLNWVKKQ